MRLLSAGCQLARSKADYSSQDISPKALSFSYSRDLVDGFGRYTLPGSLFQAAN
jgi:hypothetical protein